MKFLFGAYCILNNTFKIITNCKYFATPHKNRNENNLINNLNKEVEHPKLEFVVIECL